MAIFQEAFPFLMAKNTRSFSILSKFPFFSVQVVCEWKFVRGFKPTNNTTELKNYNNLKIIEYQIIGTNYKV
jgi:hypothetical protein